MKLSLIAVIALMLAGCSDGGSTDDTAATSGSSTAGSGGASGTGGAGSASSAAGGLDPAAACPAYCASREEECGAIANCQADCEHLLAQPMCEGEIDAWVECFTDEAVACDEIPSACATAVDALRQCTSGRCAGSCGKYKCDELVFENDCTPLEPGQLSCVCTIDDFVLGTCIDDQELCGACCESFGFPPFAR